LQKCLHVDASDAKKSIHTGKPEFEKVCRAACISSVDLFLLN